MKKMISVLSLMALVSVVAFAQPKNNNKKKDGEQWREKVRAEQVAFITTELDLTESEAQVFWPVYNDVQKQRREAFKTKKEAYNALQEGLKNGTDVSKLLDDYLNAKKGCDKVDADALGRYKKVLPIEKVARLTLAEEKFRHRQIGKLGKKGGNGPRNPRPDNNSERFEEAPAEL